MAGLKTYLLGGATLACAFAIGYVMQYGPGSGARPDTLRVADIAMTSSGTATRKPAPADAGGTRPEPAAARIDEADAPGKLAATGDCAPSLSAATGAGAMVDLSLVAPCHPVARVTVHHQGLMLTEVLDRDGALRLSVPALAEQAVFIAELADGTVTSAEAEVPGLVFYDRVALQWKGTVGLQLHAREFGADYFGEGHVWAASAGKPSDAALGHSGFLTQLGQGDAPEARLVEVYTFPSGTAGREGAVALSVEAEVTAQNCGLPVNAQTLERRAGGGLKVHDLSLRMPACETVGDFIVLKNLIEDLKIATR